MYCWNFEVGESIENRKQTRGDGVLVDPHWSVLDRDIESQLSSMMSRAVQGASDDVDQASVNVTRSTPTGSWLSISTFTRNIVRFLVVFYVLGTRLWIFILLPNKPLLVRESFSYPALSWQIVVRLIPITGRFKKLNTQFRKGLAIDKWSTGSVLLSCISKCSMRLCCLSTLETLFMPGRSWSL